MRRSDREISLAKRRCREHRQFRESQVGRFRKRDAYDCGITRCLLCHGDKFPKRLPTLQEKFARLQLREGLTDLES